MNKRAISGVITTVILIALALAIVAIVWVVVNNLVKGQVRGAESCFDIFDKVKLNRLYTCWNSTASEDYFHFSISIEDVDVDEVLVSISSAGATNSLRITNTAANVTNVENYPADGVADDIVLPGKNSGLTYVHKGLSGIPDSIEIVPVVDGEQCKISDSIYDIENC